MTPMTFLRTALAAALLAAGAPAALAQQKLIPQQSEIAFTTKQMGVPVEGKFRKFDAQLAFDPKRPEAGKVSIAIDAASASFGIADTDAELPKPAWFGAAKFPQATFQSTAIKAAGPSRFDVAGRLSVKGNSRDVVVPVTLAQAGGATRATGTFTIRRLDFKVGEGEWTDTSLVANDVVVKFSLAFSGLGAP